MKPTKEFGPQQTQSEQGCWNKCGCFVGAVLYFLLLIGANEFFSYGFSPKDLEEDISPQIWPSDLVPDSNLNNINTP